MWVCGHSRVAGNEADELAHRGTVMGPGGAEATRFNLSDKYTQDFKLLSVRLLKK